MGSWYLVVKTIHGTRYLYRQRSWREGKSVRTQCQCLGAVGDGHMAPRRAATERVRFASAEEANNLWERDELVGLASSDLDARQIAAISSYTANGYSYINRTLRSHEVISELDADEMSAVLSAIERPNACLKHDVVLYRKCLIEESAATVGHRIYDYAFMSFTVDESAARDFSVHPEMGYKSVILRMRSKKGSRGYISAKGLTSFNKEKEVVRFGGEFIILDVSSYNGIIYCDIQEVFDD